MNKYKLLSSGNLIETCINTNNRDLENNIDIIDYNKDFIVSNYATELFLEKLDNLKEFSLTLDSFKLLESDLIHIKNNIYIIELNNKSYYLTINEYVNCYCHYILNNNDNLKIIYDRTSPKYIILISNIK
ncbi:hypothetical protein crov355 [Cafeteria roenbergensis virus]|uniref:Uncharacterized protein n=1 Tax=Cafeteria roenbergensis virus (strain BV-PW1) TaxID=693272 RepID=E3T5C6_CROVB|nr:hypothetical protein crov355 [Cafeteria roenbergensis virus BV-PW1]ADO67389.1 hypothetical protein crov355 [Cafeteria roenbergensis virus BV-PW1]